MRKNSNIMFLIGRTDKIVASVKAVKPVAPHLIQPCEKSKVSGSLRVI